MRHLMIATLAFFLFLPATVTAETIDAANAVVVKEASFRGDSGHQTSGTVKLLQDQDSYFLLLEDDFRFDGAPDPKLGFSDDGRIVKTSLFTRLRSNNGRQLYRLPTGFQPTQFDQVTLYCERFSVPLGQALWS